VFALLKRCSLQQMLQRSVFPQPNAQLRVRTLSKHTLRADAEPVFFVSAYLAAVPVYSSMRPLPAAHALTKSCISRSAMHFHALARKLQFPL